VSDSLNISLDDYLTIQQLCQATNGYPICGGSVESACRHLLKDLMELTGMRWRTACAQAMLDLGSVFLKSDWDASQ
jgi:hypothetical protein